jgi:hypothetical protein
MSYKLSTSGYLPPIFKPWNLYAGERVEKQNVLQQYHFPNNFKTSDHKMPPQLL